MNRTLPGLCLALAGVSLLVAQLAGCGGGGGAAGDPAVSAPVIPTWSPQAYVKASNTEQGEFGISVALSGDTLVVGADTESGNQTTITNGSVVSVNQTLTNAGAAYVFVRSGGNWTQQAYLKASNADQGDDFGYAVAISGDTIVVGAPHESSNQTTITNGSSASADNSLTSSGAAYVFVRNGTTWSQQAYLKAPNAANYAYFGFSVAVSGDTAVVGADNDSSAQTTISNGGSASADNTAIAAGAAYVFVRSGTTWSPQAYLKAPNAGAGQYFGYSVGISGDTVVVGSLYEPSNQTTVTNGSGASNDRSARGAGAAYVFVRSGVNWTQQAYLKASNAAAGSLFGISSAISGDTIVVGAYSDSSKQATVTNGSGASADTSLPNAGAAYVFVRNGTTWSQQAYLKASNPDSDDYFGGRLGVSGDTVVVGAFGESSNQTSVGKGSSASADNSVNRAGAAYVFTRSGTSWSQQAYLKAANPDADDRFCFAAVDGDTVAVGAPGEASNQTTITNGSTASADNSRPVAGAVYVFKRGN